MSNDQFSRKPGTKVHYIAFPGATPENGMVKAVHPMDPNIVYVVYKCDGQWERYKDFTGQGTFVGDLREGWCEKSK